MCPTIIRRSASPGRLSEFEEELFKNSDGEVPVVIAVTLTVVESQRQVRVKGGPGKTYLGVMQSRMSW